MSWGGGVKPVLELLLLCLLFRLEFLPIKYRFTSDKGLNQYTTFRCHIANTLPQITNNTRLPQLQCSCLFSPPFFFCQKRVSVSAWSDILIYVFNIGDRRDLDCMVVDIMQKQNKTDNMTCFNPIKL